MSRPGPDASPSRLFPSRASALAAIALFAAAVLAAYHPVLSYPFVQDDWKLLSAMQARPGIEFARSFFEFGTRLLYRPLSMAYHIVLYNAAGPDPRVWHALALAWMAAGALLASAVLFQLTRDRALALAAGLACVAATPVHMESLVWAVGLNALAGPAALLAAFWLHLRGRRWTGAIVYLLSVLFYEGGIVLPAVLIVHEWLSRDGARWRARAASSFTAVLPFLVALAVAVLPKIAPANPTALQEDHPYAMRVFSTAFVDGFVVYAKWTLDGIAPWLAECMAKERLFDEVLARHSVLFASVLAAAVVAGSLLLGRARIKRRAAWLTLLAWTVIALVPFAPMVNHRYRYFLVYLLPPALGLAFAAALWLLRRLAPARFVTPLLALIVLAQVAAGARYFHHRDGEGLGQRFKDGSGSMIHKAHLVRMAQEAVARLAPQLPGGAHIVFGNTEVWAFHRHSGPRMWTGDPELDVINAWFLRHDERGPYVEGEPGDEIQEALGGGQPRRYIDPDKTFVLWVEGGRMTDRTDEYRRLWAQSRAPDEIR